MILNKLKLLNKLKCLYIFNYKLIYAYFTKCKNI